MRLFLVLLVAFLAVCSAQVTYNKVATVLTDPAFDLLEESYDAAVQAVASYAFILGNLESQISYYQGLLAQANVTLSTIFDNMVSQFVTTYNDLPSKAARELPRLALRDSDKEMERCIRSFNDLRTDETIVSNMRKLVAHH